MIARVRATDADAGANAILTYTLEADQNDMFSITPETGEIRLEKNRIGPESSSNEVGKETVYHLVVVASDGGAFAYYYYYYYCFFFLFNRPIFCVMLRCLERSFTIPEQKPPQLIAEAGYFNPLHRRLSRVKCVLSVP